MPSAWPARLPTKASQIGNVQAHEARPHPATASPPASPTLTFVRIYISSLPSLNSIPSSSICIWNQQVYWRQHLTSSCVCVSSLSIYSKYPEVNCIFVYSCCVFIFSSLYISLLYLSTSPLAFATTTVSSSSFVCISIFAFCISLPFMCVSLFIFLLSAFGINTTTTSTTGIASSTNSSSFCVSLPLYFSFFYMYFSFSQLHLEALLHQYLESPALLRLLLCFNNLSNYNFIYICVYFYFFCVSLLLYLSNRSTNGAFHRTALGSASACLRLGVRCLNVVFAYGACLGLRFLRLRLRRATGLGGACKHAALVVLLVGRSVGLCHP